MRDRLAAQCVQALVQHAPQMSAVEFAAALWGLARSGAPAADETALQGVWQVGREGDRGIRAWD
jgi:hypothetical protein